MRNSTINNSIRIILGILIINFILWNRLIRERMPIEITELSLHNSIIIIIIILLILGLILNIKKLMPTRKKSSKLIDKILSMSWLMKIQQYLSSPKYLYEKLSDKYSFQQVIEKPFSYLTIYLNYPKRLTLLFLIIPKILFAILFFTDVVFYHQFNLIYSFIFLPLIPIIFNSYLYIAEDFSSKYVHYLSHHLVFNKINDNEFDIEPITIIPDIPKALTLSQIQEKFDVIVDHWEIYTTILNYIKNIHESSKNISTYATIFCLTFYLFSWGYILITLAT